MLERDLERAVEAVRRRAKVGEERLDEADDLRRVSRRDAAGVAERPVEPRDLR